jgi:hypothetical protein
MGKTYNMHGGEGKYVWDFSGETIRKETTGKT